MIHFTTHQNRPHVSAITNRSNIHLLFYLHPVYYTHGVIHAHIQGVSGRFRGYCRLMNVSEWVVEGI